MAPFWRPNVYTRWPKTSPKYSILRTWGEEGRGDYYFDMGQISIGIAPTTSFVGAGLGPPKMLRN